MIACFGAFSFDDRTGRLHRDGKYIPLQALPSRLLGLLARAEGELVRHQDLCMQLWPDRTVAFDRSLHTAVKQLRRALGDNARRPSYVGTDVGRGYRLLVPVRWVGPANDVHPSRWRSRAAAVIAGAIGLSALMEIEPTSRGDDTRHHQLSPLPKSNDSAVKIVSRVGQKHAATVARVTSIRPATNSVDAAFAEKGESHVDEWALQRAQWKREREQWAESRRAWAAERPEDRSPNIE